MIGIGGVEGDVRRINVRATEIQLSDRSTMIVPNSQLISQNVRNATMGNAQGGDHCADVPDLHRSGAGAQYLAQRL